MSETEKALEKIRQARLAYYAAEAQQESEPIVEECAFASGSSTADYTSGSTRNSKMVIARYPTRAVKKIEVDADKPVFSVADMCVLLGCSRWTVIRLFENEPGVLILLRPETMHKRRRRMIRIPRAVYLRVRAKLLG